MSIIGWMLSRMILMRFLAFLVGITGFVITLQVFTLVDDILKAGGNKLIAVAEYALLLWPVTAATFVAVCALLAVLLTLVELSARNELAAIWGTGVSPYRLVLMLMPVGLTLGGAIGPWFAGFMFDVTGSYRVAFLLSTAFCVGGSLCFWLADRRHK